MNPFEYVNPVLTPANLFTSPQDMIAILVIALIVFGPKKLPEIGRQVGTALRELNKMRGDLQKALDLDEYTRYDSTPHYHSAPYGATYPANDSHPAVEPYVPPAAGALDSYMTADEEGVIHDVPAPQPKLAPPPGPRREQAPAIEAVVDASLPTAEHAVPETVGV